jgi:hypothetical protein
VFVLTASRSGSTLLRFLLDSHPVLAAPPETSVCLAVSQLARTIEVLDNAGSPSQPVTSASEPSPEALAEIRDVVDRAYGRYLKRRGKQRWCDKSLDNYMNAELLSLVYPEAKFICLFRHCMDVVASGVEVCPWGLHRHGFDAYVSQFPGNSVAAIGSYWLACAQGITGFADKHPERCHRVRYEDLVTAPEETMAGVFGFLEVEQVPGISEAAFDTPHEGNGPGDEKIWFTTGVTSVSMGRGDTVPVQALPGPLLDGINGALGQLGYRQVDDKWNITPGRDPRADAPGQPAAAPAGEESPEVAEAVREIRERVDAGSLVAMDQIVSRWPALAGQTVVIVIHGEHRERQEVRCVFPGPDAAPEPVATIIADAGTWRSLLNGTTNVVSEMAGSRLRCENNRDSHRIRSDEVHAIAALLGIAKIPLELSA